MSITSGQLCHLGPPERALCGRTTAPGYCPAEEMGHFPENFQPGQFPAQPRFRCSGGEGCRRADASTETLSLIQSGKRKAKWKEE